MRRALLAAGVAATLIAALTATARAESSESPPPADVAVIRPVGDDRVLGEAAARIGLELTASGLTNTLVDVAGDDYPARIALVREDGVATINLIGTLGDGSPLHRRVPVPAAEGGDDPAVLAVRAVELLRGIRLGVRAARTAGPAAPPADEPDEPAAPPPPAPQPVDGERVRLGVGACMLVHSFGNGTRPAPLLSMSATLSPHFAVAAVLAGAFSTSFAPTPEGSAHARQSFGALGARYDSSRERSSLHLFLGIGYEHVEADPDDRGLTAANAAPALHVRSPRSLWQPLVMLSAGVSGHILRWLGITFDTGLVMSPPTLDVVVSGQTLGSLAGPSFFSSISAWAAFP